jgi:His/Glu/Gln/Arg/opine family amino acid ABC transporter permease subunit
MDFAFLSYYVPALWRGAITTIELSILCLACGGALGVLTAVARVLGGTPTNRTLGVVVDFIRTTPLLVQVLAWYLGTSAMGFGLDPFSAAVVALSVNAGAFISEIVRGSVLGVPRGQREAALSVGLSAFYSVFAIEIPQALPAIVPALISFYIGLIKDTSLAYMVGLLELTRTAAFISNEEGRPVETYLVVGMIYFLICFPVSQFGKYVDKRLRRTGLAQERLFV